MPPSDSLPKPEADAAPGPRTLGRFLMIAFGLLFLMVFLGIFWVWHRFSREQAWREKVGQGETFVAPQQPVRR